MSMRVPPPTHGPYWLFFLILVAALYAASLFIPDGVFTPVHEFEKGEAAKVAVEQLNLLSTLMLTLNTSLITGGLAVTVNAQAWNPRWNGVDSLAVLLLLGCGAAVYYGVYLGYAVMLEMIAAGFVDPFQRRLVFALGIQYHAFMAGFLALGIVFCRILESRGRNKASRRRRP